tara:strand:+ start:972 stop:1238 length:267 start_codon:yes stop_codon:yes gene_type:complete
MIGLAKLLTVKETADLLAISPSTLRDLVRHGEIAFVQRGRGIQRLHLALHPSEIESYIKRNTKRGHLSDDGFLEQRTARLAVRKAARR